MRAALRISPILVDDIHVSVFRIPCETPESDATLVWDSTTIIVVEAMGGGAKGLGYAYTGAGAVPLIEAQLIPVVRGRDAMDIPGMWAAMMHAVREQTRPGLATSAISAMDVALWDLKARLLDLPLAVLLGRARSSVPVYGSGGFTSADIPTLQRQLCGWTDAGMSRVKMKVGREPARDIDRVRAARQAIGTGPELFVDANGGYDRKQALRFADAFVKFGVTWFEEPVSSDDVEGLRLLRDRAPGGMEITAGEYGHDLFYFRRLLEAHAVDVLQADARRCGGVTGFMKAAALCEAHAVPLSSHTAPALHLPLGCASPIVRHLEYFYDHVRVEQLLFDGIQVPVRGALSPDLDRPGLGLELKQPDAQRYAV